MRSSNGDSHEAQTAGPFDKLSTADIRSSRGLSTAVGASICLALFGSLVEVLTLYIERQSHPFLRLSRDFFWMAPSALIVVTLAAMTPCVLLASLWPGRLTLALVLLVPASLVFLDLLMLVPHLSHYAAAILAVGLAVQTTRTVRRHSYGTRKLVGPSIPVLIVCLTLVSSYVWLRTTQARSPVTAAPAVSGLPRPANVLLITLDTVRASNLSLYGYSRPTTPKLERFARRGIVFERAFATAPWTLPSHASLFTGRWPHELSAGYESALDGTYPTLAEYLSGRGYATAGFAANLGYCSFETGLGRGFGHYEDYPRSLGQIASSSTLVRNVADNFHVRTALEDDQHLNRVTAEDINRRVLAWLTNRATDSPFFIFVNYFDAHEPYLPPKPFATRFGPGRSRGRYSPLHRWLWDVSVAHSPMTLEEVREEVDAYDGALAYLDDQLGSLLDELEHRHVLDDTLVIITADHGEELGEHAVFDHGYTLYRQALQVPLLIVAPGRVPGGRRIAASVSLRDVPATIVDTIGIRAGTLFPGESLATRWAPSAESRDQAPRPLLSEVSQVTGQPEWFPASKGDMKGVFYGGFHYIRNGDGTEELYRIDSDPVEQENVATHVEYQKDLMEGRVTVQSVAGDLSGPRRAR